MNIYNNAIIAGTNKAGSTSVFKYLSDHPDIIPSKIKETNFFLNANFLTDGMAIERYFDFFDLKKEKGRICLEASPEYLSNGIKIVERIKRSLPEVKLIFLLRNPVDRLHSYFVRNQQTQHHPDVGAMEYDDYIDLIEKVAKANASSKESGPEKNAFIQYKRGCYAENLKIYFDCFPSNNIFIGFFDELVIDSKSLMKRLSDFLEIDPEFYNHYSFNIENKTKEYRVKFLQKTGSRLNMLLEPFFNKNPKLKELLRKILLKERSTDTKIILSNSNRERIQYVYASPNKALARFLLPKCNEIKLPDWL